MARRLDIWLRTVNSLGFLRDQIISSRCWTPGADRYGALDDPGVLVEIADWEPAEAQQAYMQEATATGASAPVRELMAASFRATAISPLPRCLFRDRSK